MKIFTTASKEEAAILSAPCAKVEFPLSQERKDLIEAIKKKLFELGGVGLAAPQVGVNVKIIAIYIPKDAASIRDHARAVPMTVFLNPSCETIGQETFEDWEGCYSVPDTMGKVSRTFRIRLRAQDELGNKVDKEVEGFFARVLQHEIDHVHGKLITTRFHKHSLFGPMAEMMEKRIAELSPEKRAAIEKLKTKQKKD